MTDVQHTFVDCGCRPAMGRYCETHAPNRRYDANDPRNPSCVADAIADLTVQAARIADALNALGKQASYGH